MSARRFLLSRAAGICVLPLAILAWSCRDVNEPTAPSVLLARAAASSGPTVSSVVPDSSERGVTLDITVNGSGFDQASAVKFERGGVPASGVTVNNTKYVTSRKLIANVTIAAAADTGKYDVAVTDAGDRKGIGVEMFTVTYQIAELGIIGGTWSRANAINDNGEVAGASCTNDCLSTAFYWSQAAGQVDLGGMAGYSRSAAAAINNRGQVFGMVECLAADPGCGGVYTKQLVRWDRVNGSWTIAAITGCSVVNPLGDASRKFVINNNDDCVGKTANGQLVLQKLSGTAAVDQAYLPSLVTGGSSFGYGISDAPMVAGTSTSESGWQVPVAWYRNTVGDWVVLRLNFPGSDNFGRASDIGGPDAAGRVWVSGYTENSNASRNNRITHAVRWALQADGFGGWRVASTEVLPYSGTGRSVNAWGVAVNTGGDVVGNSGGYVDASNPVKWAINGGVEALPNSTGGAQGRALDINNQGWIIGAVFDSKNNCDRAAIWRQQ